MPKTKFFQYLWTKSCREHSVKLFWECCSGCCGSVSGIQLRQLLRKQPLQKGRRKKSLKGAQSHKAPHTDIAKGEWKWRRAKCDGRCVCADKSQSWCSNDRISRDVFSEHNLIDELLDKTHAWHLYICKTDFFPFSSELFKHNCSFSKPNTLLWIGNLPNDHQFSTQTTKQLKISYVCMLSWFAVSSPWSPLLSSSLWFMILISSRAFVVKTPIGDTGHISQPSWWTE